jgi:hypothetical protein
MSSNVFVFTADTPEACLEAMQAFGFRPTQTDIDANPGMFSSLALDALNYPCLNVAQSRLQQEIVKYGEPDVVDIDGVTIIKAGTPDTMGEWRGGIDIFDRKYVPLLLDSGGKPNPLNDPTWVPAELRADYALPWGRLVSLSFVVSLDKYVPNAELKKGGADDQTVPTITDGKGRVLKLPTLIANLGHTFA